MNMTTLKQALATDGEGTQSLLEDALADGFELIGVRIDQDGQPEYQLREQRQWTWLYPESERAMPRYHRNTKWLCYDELYSFVNN